MKLEVNKSHKKVNFDKLKKPIKAFKVTLASLLVAISMYSGSVSTNVNAAEVDNSSIVWNIDDQEVNIPESISDDIAFKLGKEPGDTIRSSDLDKITFLTIEVDKRINSLEFLKYFNNLETLYIFIDSDSLDILNDLAYSKSLVNVNIMSRIDEYKTLDKDSLSFIEKSDSIKKITLTDNYLLSPGCEEELNKLEELELIGGVNYDIDFSKLNNLKVLDLSACEPYDIAVYLNSSEYNSLISKGVTIKFSDENAKNKYLNASSKLDEIVSKLDVSKDSSTEEKMNAILIYVMENLSYDEEVSKMVSNNIDTDEKASEFYEDGRLYGSLYKNSAICGNYAALTEALMDRLDIPQNSFFVTSNNHAWNLIRIDGEPYYVDATWMDNFTKKIQESSETYDENGHKVVSISFLTKYAADFIKEGNTDELNWYKESINYDDIASMDKYNSHVATYIPDYATKIEEKNNDKVGSDVKGESSDEKVKVKIGTKEILIGSGALIGILGAVCGTVIAIKKKKENERRRRMMMSGMFGNDYNDSYTQTRRNRF